MKVTIYMYDDRRFPRHVEFTKEEAQALESLTPEKLIAHMRHGVIGKVIPTPGQKEYYAPRFNIAGFSLSMQISYYVWKERTNNNLDLSTPITEEEFDKALNGPDDYVDFCASFHGEEYWEATQMPISKIAASLSDIGYYCLEVEDAEQSSSHQLPETILFNIKIATENLSIMAKDMEGKSGIICLGNGVEVPFEILVADETE